MKLVNSKLLVNEKLYIMILFLLSLLNPIFGVVFYIGAIRLVYNSGMVGIIKYIIFVTMRDLLSLKIAVSLSSLNTFKLFIFILLALYCIYISLMDKCIKKNLNVILSCIFFCILAALFSFCTGSYPITSIFKCISFGIVFCALIIGIVQTKDTMDWCKYLITVLTPFFIISFLVIPFPSFRIINDNFQGIFNHVNMCGIMCTIYITFLLFNKIKNNKEMITKIILIIMTLFMQYLTFSRTGMLVSIIVIFINFVFNRHSMVTYLLIASFMFGCYIVYNLNDDIKSLVNTTVVDYIYKGNQEDIFASRRILQKEAENKYSENPFIGSGFMTPYIRDYVDYSLNTSLNVEPGSIIWTLFGDVGIFGTIAFIIFVCSIVISGRLKNIFLILCVFGICSGEMVFFSINNGISIFLYLLLASYISYKK